MHCSCLSVYEDLSLFENFLEWINIVLLVLRSFTREDEEIDVMTSRREMFNKQMTTDFLEGWN